MHPYLQLLENRMPVIFDGAMGTLLQKKQLAEKDFLGHVGCNEILNLSRPDIISQIHYDYYAAGAHVATTNTFGANRVKLAQYGLETKVTQINSAAVVLARNAISNTFKGPLFVCGSLGPTGMLPSSSSTDLAKISFDELEMVYSEQADALIEAGVDLLLIETGQDLLEMRAALIAIRKSLTKHNKKLPIQVQATMDSSGRMLLGGDVNAFLGAVAGLNPDVVGLNCSSGPNELIPIAKRLVDMTAIPISMIPNAGVPRNIDGQALYEMSGEQFAQLVAPAVYEIGISVVGGCCGTTPEHIAHLAELLKDKYVAPRSKRVGVYTGSGISGINLEEAARPFIIGERLNTQGSRTTKELVLALNYEELFRIAQEQANSGCTLIDICVAVNERDNEAQTMAELIAYLSERVITPFCIDTTEPLVLEAAIKRCPGSVMINSINLEHGGAKARRILELARQFGCPVIALTIDDKGMATTVERKLEIAAELHRLACGTYGLPPQFLYIDPLVFTLATGERGSADAARNSLEALQQIKKTMPDVRTVMGVSNVSYGLKGPMRRILNNLMLFHAAKAGLDAAIFNPLQLDDIETYNTKIRIAGENLLFNRSSEALEEFIRLFEHEKPSTAEGNNKAATNTIPAEKRLAQNILARDPRGIEQNIEELLSTVSAVDVLNNILLPAMTEVGRQMEEGQMILPFVLQAAEVMKKAIQYLEPHLKKNEALTKGRVVLATVYGDVHDIGKNLVGSILKNQGYDIIDLGKQVPLEDIVDAVKKYNPDAVGLSALLIATSREMQRCVNEFDKQGIKVPILIGGAAVNREFARRIEILSDGRRYSGGVYYGKDAFEASKILQQLLSSNGIQSSIDSKTHDYKKIELYEKSSHNIEQKIVEVDIPLPPFYGTSNILTWDSSTLLQSIDKTKLFKGYWGGGKLAVSDFERAVKEDFMPVFLKLCEEILNKNLIDSRAIYGYFPIIVDDCELIILNPSDFHTQIASFTFPRIAKKANRCFTDYFKAEGDLLAIQVVTIGDEISRQCYQYIQKENNYSLGFFLNGIAGYVTEMLAERVSAEIRRGLFLSPSRGKRYSFGYRGMPPVQQQKQLFEIMAIEERLGITLTECGQMQPEHSTMGVFVHHPQAEYL